jgi:hypothetical protein
MEDKGENLTVKHIAGTFAMFNDTCSKRLQGKVSGMPPLIHLAIGRREIMRRQWLN